MSFGNAQYHRDFHWVNQNNFLIDLNDSHIALSGSHHEHDAFAHWEISNNITLPTGFRGTLIAGPNIELIEDELNNVSGSRFIINREGHYTLYAHGRFGNKNDEAKLYVNIYDVSGNPQTRYTAELPPGAGERDYQVTTRELQVGQQIELEVENIDTNTITWLGRTTDASGFVIVNSDFIICRSQGSGT